LRFEYVDERFTVYFTVEVFLIEKEKKRRGKRYTTDMYRERKEKNRLF